MIYVIAGLVALAATLLVIGIAELALAQPRALTRQLSTMEQLSRGTARVPDSSAQNRIADLLGRLGRGLQQRGERARSIKDLLSQAGFRRAEAVSIFWGARISAAVGLPFAAVAALAATGASGGAVFMAAVWGAAFGWLTPKLYLRNRVRARRQEIDRNLPDALDLLVVCMEAGLGLNQALARMAEEIRHFSVATSEEFVLVNLEMRAGVPRVDALRGLGSRMGVPELRSLAAMLIQADRFGTSVAQALRVHAETARTKRRQRAEEAAAKTTIKLIFPLVLCIFPTVFAVVLGPAVIGIVRTLSGM